MDPARRTRIILAHADRRIPRYTSYPTTPHFTPEIDTRCYRRWLADLPPATPVSLYLHVPFCRSMCWYCGCHTKATLRSDPIDRYLGALEREIELVAAALPGRPPVIHIHWGGGSPTLVRGEQFVGIMDRIRRRFDVQPTAEIAIEIDPRTLRDDLVAMLPRAGVNRASIGVQTFDPRVQAAINRFQPPATVEDAARRLRQAGVRGLNADLLYGLPYQTAESAAETTERLLELAPDRVSVFGYAHMPRLKPHHRMIAEESLPGAAERLAQADAIAAVLQSARYVPVGLDHFVLPGDPMAAALRRGVLRRNFQGYTTDTAEALIGLGASAIGSLPQGYVQNTVATGAWESAIMAGDLATCRGHALNPDDRLRRAIIGEVMCRLEVDLAAIAAAHGRPAPAAALDALETDGVVRRRGDRLTIDPAFRPLARVVAAAFDSRLERAPARHAIAV